jgi:hypothetical protein
VLWWKHFCCTAIWLTPTWWPRWQQVVPVGATNADVAVVEARKISATHVAVTLDRDNGDAVEVSPVERMANLIERRLSDPDRRHCRVPPDEWPLPSASAYGELLVRGTS